MKRHMIAAAAALSLALSGMAAPAAAKDRKDDQLLKLILGAAAIGLVMNQMNGGQLFGPKPAPAPQPAPQPLPSYQTQRLIPGECAMDVMVGGRLRQVVSASCAREFGLTARLPAECAFDLQTTAGVRSVYGPQCLSGYGYRVAQIRY